MTTRRLPTRYPRALALEPRILLDAAATATAETVIAATDSKPGVTARGVAATVTISETDTRQSVDLFSGVSVSADGSNQALSNLVISVNSSGSNQALVIDGTTITLVAGSGDTAGNGYFYTTTISGSTTTITLALNASTANSTTDVASLIDGINYATLDNSVESQRVTVTLNSLSDSDDTGTLGIQSTIAITSNINVAPQLSSDEALTAAETFTIQALGSAREVVYSSDGDYAYAAGENGLSVFSVDSQGRMTLTQTLSGITQLGTISYMAISGDGTSIYTLSGNNTINQLRVGADGTLSYVGSLQGGNGELTGSLAITADGAYVYAGSASNGLVIFRRDASTGALTEIGRGPQDNSRHGIVTTTDDYVYALYTDGTPTLYVYARNNDGTLNSVAEYTTDSWSYDPVSYALVASADGKYVFIGDPQNGTLSVLQFDGSTLRPLTSLSLSGISGLALSSDASVLYASQSDGTLSAYNVASNGSLSPSSSFSGSNGARDIALSSDGLSLLVAGSNVSRYTSIQTLDTTQALSFASGLTLSDSNYAALANGAGNYQGARITVTADTRNGSFGFAAGNGLTLSNGVIALNGNTIASLTGTASQVSVTFNAEVSASVANQVLHQLTYSNSSLAAGSLIQLRVVGSDSELNSTAHILTLRTSTAPQLNTQAATGYTLDNATSETAYRYTLLAELFSDADGDNLNWSVSGLPEGLAFDAATRTISGATRETGTFALTVSARDASGGSASLALELVVEQIANRAPQVSDSVAKTLSPATQNSAYSTTLNAALFSDGDSVYGDTLSWSVSGLPAGLSFDASTLTVSGTAAVLGSYTVTVTATDTSGLSSSTELTLRVIDSTEASNRTPVFNIDASDLSYSSDGALSGFGYYVNSITLSDDGATLIIAASTSNNGNGDSSLRVYARNTETGALTLKQTFIQGTANDGDASNGIEIDGLNNVSSVTLSTDNTRLYLAGFGSTGSATAYTLSVFSVDSDNASLSLIGSVAGIGEKVLELQVADSGNTLYALSATSVYAYAIDNGNGALAALGTYSNDFSTAVAMQVGDDGTLYVLSSNRLTVYEAANNGSLTYAGQLVRSGAVLTYTDSNAVARVIATPDNTNAFNGARSLAVSDAGHIYLVTSNGFLTTLHYDSATDALNLVSAQDAFTPLGQYPHGIVLSDDGSALYVVSGASNRLAVYSVGDDGSATLSKVIETSGGASKLAVSADGKSIYAGPNVFFAPGLRLISSTGLQVTYLEGSSVALAENVSIADAEYDALAGGAGNYNGAVISLTRAAGDDGSDTFGFTDGNGLTLQNGVIRLNGAVIANLTSADGTLSVTFTGDVSTAQANQVLHQLSYRNTSSNPGSRITLQLSVADTYTVSTTEVVLAVNEINDAPTLTTDSARLNYSVGGEPIKLFSGSVVSTGEDSQIVTRLTLTVSGLGDSTSDSLYVDGQRLALVEYSSLYSTITLADGTRYSYIVTVEILDGTATLTLAPDNSDGLPADQVARLIDSLAYRSDATSGTRTITLTSITDSGGTANAGVDTTALAIASSVTLSSSNTAPTLNASGGTPDYLENGAAVSLFSNVVLSTGESGQGIRSLTLSVTGLVDGNSEALLIDGTRIALVASGGSTANGLVYAVSLSEGVATVTLTSSDGLSTRAATALIESLAYANSSEDPTGGNRSVRLLSVRDDGGTLNSGTDTAPLNVSASVNVLPVNDAPLLQATPTQAIYAQASSSVALFSNVRLSTIDRDQAISSITFSVTGVLDGANETLNLDGTRIALVAGTGSTALYRYSVTLDGNTATVQLSATAAIATRDAITLIQQASYANLSALQSVGTRSFGLGVQDNGGTANGAVDSTTLATRATLTVIANSTPQLTAGPDDQHLAVADRLSAINGLSDVTASALSVDGGYLYLVASDGTLAIVSRHTGTGDLTLLQSLSTGLDTASSVRLSADGSRVYVLGNEGDRIAVFSRSASDGSLTLQQTLTTENVVDLAVAGDGSALYGVDGNYSGLRVYSLDSNGQYTLTQSIASSTSSEPYLFTAVSVEVVGDYVYVITDPASSAANTLIVYQAGSDGQLSPVAWLRDGQQVGDAVVTLASVVDVAVAGDGRTLYVASSNGVALFSFDPAGNRLSYSGQLSGLSNVTGVALSSDADTLYVTSDTGSISRYRIDGTSLTLLGSIASSNEAALAGAAQVISANNGSVVVIGSRGVVSLTDRLVAEVPLTYTEQGSVLLAERLNLSDADYDVLAEGAGNYNGATVSVIREGGAQREDTYSLEAGNGLTLANGVVTLNGSAIATFSVSEGTLTLRFTAEVSTATANAVLQQISYRNSSDDPAATLRLSLTVTDSYAASVSTTLVLGVTAVNDAPTLNTTAATASYSEGGSAASLFSASSVSSVEAGQTLTGLTLTVAGLSDGSREILNVGGTAIALIEGTGTTAQGHSYSVTVANGVATVTLSSSGMGSTAAAALIDGLSYANTSQDPTTGTRTITLTALQDSGGTANGGSDTTPLNNRATVSVNAANNPPTVTSTPATARFIEGGEAVSLFSASALSTVEAGQSITRLTFTVSGLGNGASEVLSVDGTAIALVAGNGTTSSGYSYSVTLSEGVASVSLSSNGMSETAAAALIDSLRYSNTSIDPVGLSRTVTLTAVQDSGGSETTAPGIAAVVSLAGINSAPTLSTTPASATFTEGGSAASLFSATAISSIETSQGISRLTLTVSNLADGRSEVLNIDGTAIALVEGTGTTTSGYRYSVTVAEGTATVTLGSATSIAGVAAAALVDGLSYANSSQDPTTGSRAITLVSLQDTGGTDNGGVDSTTLNSRATVEVIAVNTAPIITSTPASVTFTEGSSAVSLFSGSTLSTVEAGQNVTRLGITVAGLVDGRSEVLNVDGTAIALIDGSGITTQGYGYSVTLNEGVALVTLSSAGISPAAAATLIDSLSYANASNDPGTGARIITLSDVQDSGGSQVATPNIAAQVTVIAVNDAPALSVTPANTRYSAGTTAVQVFSDAHFSTGESLQRLTGLTLTVSGVRDSAEVLIIDGSSVALNNGVSLTTRNGLNVSVTRADGSATLMIGSRDGLSPEAAQALINGLGYANDSAVISVGVRNISLNSVQDSGGTANAGNDTARLNIAASVTVLNSAPQATDATLTLAGATARQDYSAVLLGDGFSDVNGDSLSLSVSGLPQGLSFDAATRTLSGVPQTAGTYTLTVTATDSAGASASRSVVLEVARPNVQPVVTVEAARSPLTVLNAPLAFDAPALNLGITPVQVLADIETKPHRAAASDTPLANATGTLAEQLLEADNLQSDSLDRPLSGGWVLEGSVLVSRVAPAVDGARTVSLSLPTQLPDGSTPTRVALASGLPLPNWVRFDARSGQLQVDRGQLTRLGSVRLIVTGRDLDGRESRTELRIHNDQRPPQHTPAPEREQPSPGVPAQLRQSAPSALLEDARALLESLSGLNDRTAPTRPNA